MNVIPIASSSKGNAYVIEQDGLSLLIDCGVSVKCLKSAFGLLGLSGVLITHNHVDHVSGLKRLLNEVDVPVFANSMTAEAIVEQEHIADEAFVCFENGQPFDVGPFSVTPFSIPHDAADPVGFLIRGDQVYFHGTDIGTPLDSIGVKIASAELVMLESNHDPVLLKTSKRPPNLKQRIYGPRGHLSNDQACELVRKFASPSLRHVWLAHLSGECNSPRIALDAMKETLASIGRTDVIVEVAE